MVTLLAKIFVRGNKDKNAVRQAYGMLCGVLGIVLNVMLFTGKFIAGLLSNSIAITADAVNNLSDAGSSFVTLIGFKLAGQKPDTEHPYGHGRMEYISGLVVAGAILLMGYELAKDSISKIITPQETEFSWLIVGILVASIGVKIYMFFYNNAVAKKIESPAMAATAKDSLSDSIATGVVLVSALISHYTSIKIDGYCGLLVALLIFYAGYGAAKDTLNPLLGQKASEEFEQEIEDLVMAHEEICGIHDLFVHDYGPGRQIISLHAEVSADSDIMMIHDVIDNIENELRTKLGCDVTIHMDPIVTNDEHVTAMKKNVLEIVKSIDERMTLHDFRMVEGPSHTNLLFDVVAPFDLKITDEELEKEVFVRTQKTLGKHYFTVIKVDKK
ncbi:MAG: cation transporter [Roseburia sp.]|nr:cation transporter [Roseburia sp.]